MTLVVGVHGVGNYLPGVSDDDASARLSELWTSALGRGFGPQRCPPSVRVAYYAAHLRPAETTQGTDDPDDLDPELQQMILAWVGQFGPPAEVAQGRGTRPIRSALEWVADRFGLDNRLARLFVTTFFQDVATYLTAGSRARLRAREVVADTIAAHRPRVVIAHSLGSVVAYEALWARPEHAVELLITVGSPLAMPDVVFSKLEPVPAEGWGARPPSVSRWINLADPGDLVAIPRHLSKHFHGIDADLEPSIHMFDFHKAGNYLASPATAAALSPYLDDPEASRRGESNP